MLAHRLRTSGREIFRTVRPKGWAGAGGDESAAFSFPSLRRKASNTWSAVQETYLSTKEIFERHRVVFTIGTSIASILTAWAGYSLRHYHQSNIEKRLGSLEKALESNHKVEREEIKKIVSSGNVSTAACIATAGTALAIGYGLGWRGGAWYADRKFRREQLKLMGQVKPHRWQFLRRPFGRFRTTRTGHRTDEFPSMADTGSLAAQQVRKSC